MTNERKIFVYDGGGGGGGRGRDWGDRRVKVTWRSKVAVQT